MRIVGIRTTLLVGYSLSSFVIFITNPYQMDILADRVVISAGWLPFSFYYIVFTLLRNKPFADHFLISTGLPSAILLSILSLSFFWSLYTRPPITDIQKTIERYRNWVIEEPGNRESVSRDIIFPQTDDRRPSSSSNGLQFKIRPTHNGNICAICRRTVDQNGNAVACPACDSLFHFPHFAEWVKVKGFCPVCRTEIIAVPE